MHEEATEQCKAHLDELLRAGVNCASGLKEILNDERTALEHQDTEALNEIAKNKHVFLTRLEELEAERLELCTTSGFNADPAAMQQLVNSCDTDSLLLGYWTHFVDLAKQCNELNIRNGAIINLRRQQIAGALAVVRGENQDNETYGRHGRDSGSAKRILAEI